jgi:hypothetical protein
MRIVGENVWLWLAFGSCVLYIPLVFWSKGLVTAGRRVVDIRMSSEEEIPKLLRVKSKAGKAFVL